MSYAALTDQELTDKLNRGESRAFTEIYERYWGLIYQHARKMLRDDQQAEDLVQDVFFTLLDRKESLQLNTSLSAYLYSTARNKVISLIRREKVKADYIEHLQHWLSGEHQPADRELLEKEFAEAIEKEILSLPPKMREVFELSRKAYLSTAEIARQRKVSEGTVKKQLYSALHILKGRFGFATKK